MCKSHNVNDGQSHIVDVCKSAVLMCTDVECVGEAEEDGGWVGVAGFSLSGKKIDMVPHTGIAVFGKE